MPSGSEPERDRVVADPAAQVGLGVGAAVRPRAGGLPRRGRPRPRSRGCPRSAAAPAGGSMRSVRRSVGRIQPPGPSGRRGPGPERRRSAAWRSRCGPALAAGVLEPDFGRVGARRRRARGRGRSRSSPSRAGSPATDDGSRRVADPVVDGGDREPAARPVPVERESRCSACQASSPSDDAQVERAQLRRRPPRRRRRRGARAPSDGVSERERAPTGASRAELPGRVAAAGAGGGLRSPVRGRRRGSGGRRVFDRSAGGRGCGWCCGGFGCGRPARARADCGGSGSARRRLRARARSRRRLSALALGR